MKIVTVPGARPQFVKTAERILAGIDGWAGAAGA